MDCLSFQFLRKYRRRHIKQLLYIQSICLRFREISKDDFEVDHAEKTVTLRVPKPQSRVILNYDKFDFQDTNGYFFKTSDIRLTLKQVQQVENDVAKKVEKRIKEDDITREAEEEGLSQLQSIFEDVIGMNTNGYSLEVTY